MGWSNGPPTWAELERRLSDGRRRSAPQNANGGDSPAWSNKRQPYEPVALPASAPQQDSAVPYAELHCHTNFSFLDGASHGEELVEEAVRLGLQALAVTDHDGLYGVVRFAEAARAYGLPTIFGAELTMNVASPYEQRVGQPDPDGAHLVVLAEDRVGYARLSRAIATAHLAAGEKGAPRLTLTELSDLARGSRAPFQAALRGMPAPEDVIAERLGLGGAAHASGGVLDALRVASLGEAADGDAAAVGAAIRRHPAATHQSGTHQSGTHQSGTHQSGHRADDGGIHWRVLTGCRKGAVARALMDAGPRAAARELARLVEAFGRAHVAVELWDHGDPLDSARNDALADLAARAGVDMVATNNVHYASPARRRLATALAAVRARRSLDEIDGWLPPAASAHLRSGAEQARRFARYPGAVERAAEIGSDCSFDLRLVAPNLPPFLCPPGLDEIGWMRELVGRGAERRYGPRGGERIRGAYAQIDHELALIQQLGFAGYFLVVWDLVEFCRRSNIFCQGRGSAANSAVCYALGITNADAVGLGLLFERFLSPERDGPPDIDIDIESDRREEVIQYIYARYGRENAAQVANVITYRSRSAIRDMGRALGFSPGQLDAWSKQVDPWGRVAATSEISDHEIPAKVLELAAEVEDFPRHLGIHSGGMVICDRPVVEVCPVEWGRFAGPVGEAGGNEHGSPLRTVLQWDKDDCAATGLVKFDLLGLGMLSALHYGVDLIAEHHGVQVDLALIPQEPAVYDMICKADTVGVFQIESRAQMATLPRLRPRTFYDLVVEVALIRPGPIQGGSVHPYIRRRNGQEAVTYLHPLLERSLKKTLGIPLFQEQLMQMAMDVAGFTGSEADQLRQAMGSKRSTERMERLKARFWAGAAGNGVTQDVIGVLWDKLAAFANYGFPESHSVSFAYLVYASCWMKFHYPAAFCAALLNAQPMGFYSPQSLVADARRHGVRCRRPEVNASGAGASLEWPSGSSSDRANGSGRGTSDSECDADGERSQPDIRLGLADVRHVGRARAQRIEVERTAHGPYTDLQDFARRVDPGRLALEALATAGAFECFGVDRRQALWAAGALAATAGPRMLAGIVTGVEAPALPGMEESEEVVAGLASDLWATGVTPDRYPLEIIRPGLEEKGVVRSDKLAGVEHGTRIWVAGIVTHRQRPATAGGTTFVNLEDETGLINVICSKGVWARYRRVARTSPALMVRGILERTETSPEAPCVLNIVADRIEALALRVSVGASRDFH